MQRTEVYSILDGERDYQDFRWNADTTTSGGQHSVAEFVLYMEDYLQECRALLSRNPSPKAETLALDRLRCVVAMGVACFEQHGVQPRSTFWRDRPKEGNLIND